jgi:hypothetical protein
MASADPGAKIVGGEVSKLVIQSGHFTIVNPIQLV